MRKRILALVVTAVMILIPIAVFAGDTTNENGKAAAEASEEAVSKEAASEDSAEAPAFDAKTAEGTGASVGVNNGIIDVNNGIIDVNNGTVVVNNGTILDNRGTVENNNGTIENNNGEVMVNNGALGVSAQTGTDTEEEKTNAGQQKGDADAGDPAASDDSGKSGASADERDAVSYSVIEGDRQTWEGKNDIVFLVDGKYSDFQGINYGLKDSGEQKKLDESNFYAKKEDDTTSITLKKEFLETLEPGEYEIIAVYGDGNAAAELTVADLDQTPDTGSEAFPWIVLCAMMTSGAGMLRLCRRKMS